MDPGDYSDAQRSGKCHPASSLLSSPVICSARAVISALAQQPTPVVLDHVPRAPPGGPASPMPAGARSLLVSRPGPIFIWPGSICYW